LLAKYVVGDFAVRKRKSLFSLLTKSEKYGIICPMNTRQKYPSDITREQFEIIRAELSSAKKVTHPSTYDLYDIFCAVLYLIKEGCTWRAIPHDFPKWQNVRYHYDIWAKPDENGISLLDRIRDKLTGAEREKQGRNSHTTMIIVDSKSVQNSEYTGCKGKKLPE
jgi:transposase